MSPSVGVLTYDLCAEALQLALPSIEAVYASGKAKRGERPEGMFVALNPLKVWEPKYDDPTGEAFMKEVVLFTHTLGDATTWEHPYDEVALAKAFQSWKNRCDSRFIQQFAPWLLGPGGTKWAGAIYRNGLPLGFSGDREYLDEAFAEFLYAGIRTVTMHLVHEPDNGLMATGPSVFPTT